MRSTEVRNNKGWLRVTALLAGEKEQYAGQEGDASISVQLGHDATNDDFLLEVTATSGDEEITSIRTFGHDVAEARRQFATAVRSAKARLNERRTA